MKKIVLGVCVLSTVAFFAACDSKTELAILNSSASNGNINSVVWADGDASWGVVARNTQSEAKEVKETNGSIKATVDNSGDGNFNVATVYIQAADGTYSATSASISQGSSNVITVKAQ